MLSTPTEHGAATPSSLQYEHFSGFCLLSGWLSSNETICFVGTGGLTAVIPASVIQAGNITLQPQQVQMQPQNLSTKGTALSLSLSYINISGSMISPAVHLAYVISCRHHSGTL